MWLYFKQCIVKIYVLYNFFMLCINIKSHNYIFLIFFEILYIYIYGAGSFDGVVNYMFLV